MDVFNEDLECVIAVLMDQKVIFVMCIVLYLIFTCDIGIGHSHRLLVDNLRCLALMTYS